MTPFLWSLFGLSLGCDVGGQLCFKLGASRMGARPAGRGSIRRRFAAHVRAILQVPWLWAGVAIYVLELAVWLAILERAPLSLAFPIASLNYCGVLLASRFLLNEQVGRRRWAGAALITLGVIIVGIGAGGQTP